MAAVHNGNMVNLPEDFETTLSTISVGTENKQEVKEAVTKETNIFKSVFEALNARLGNNPSQKKIDKFGGRLTEVFSKYTTAAEAAQGAVVAEETVYQQSNWIKSKLWNSTPVNEAQARSKHIQSHQEKLTALVKSTKIAEERLAEYKKQLLNASLTLSVQKNTALNKLTPERVQQGVVSLINNKTELTVAGEKTLDLQTFLLAMNEMLGVEESTDCTKGNAFILSDRNQAIPKEMQKTATLNVLKFCSKEAYANLINTLHNETPVGIEPILEDQVKKISVEKKDDKIVLTSEATIALTSKMGLKPFATVDAVMQTSLDEENNVEIAFNFLNVQLLPSATLRDADIASQVFPEEEPEVAAVSSTQK